MKRSSNQVRSLIPIIVMIAQTGLAVPSAHAQPGAGTYAVGNFCSECAVMGSQNQLFDDGLHGDGAAGDGIWGADIVVDQPPGSYFFRIHVGGTDTYPRSSSCANLAATLWTSGPGDIVHFRLGGARAGWFPAWAFSCDHATPAGAGMEALLFNAGGGSVIRTCPATLTGTVWSCTLTLPVAAGGQFSFRAVPGPVFTESYNAFCMWQFETNPGWGASPNSDVLFQFDQATGQMRTLQLGPTPARASTWGAVKAFYR